MKTTIFRLALFFLLAFAYAVYALPSEKPQKFSAEEVVAKHLEALGLPEARVAASTRTGEGPAEFRVLGFKGLSYKPLDNQDPLGNPNADNERIGGRVHLPGTAAFISQGHKVKWAFRFGTADYPGEQLVFDGQATHVAAIGPGIHSRLGNFIQDNSELLRTGVWGGVLSEGWTLLDLPASGAKVKSEGLKKIDGRELYDLRYLPKEDKTGRLTIHLYFEPTNFRHVMTIYRATGALGPVPDSGQQSDLAGEVVTIVEERFDDFHSSEGITLPASWEIRLHIEPSKGFEYQWKVNWITVSNQRSG